MALGIVAGVTAVTGAIAGNGVLKYNKDQYLNKISDLEALIVRLENHLVNLENLKNQLPSIWDDAKGLKMIRNIDSTITTAKLQTTYARATMKTFQDAVREMDKSTIALDSILDAANSILDAIKA